MENSVRKKPSKLAKVRSDEEISESCLGSSDACGTVDTIAKVAND
jgi:hypothetical protein